MLMTCDTSNGLHITPALNLICPKTLNANGVNLDAINSRGKLKITQNKNRVQQNRK